MARTQFTFTFTNAQAGADVTFSAPVYANASTKVQDGPRLVLDSSNAVSVWADAAHLVATTIDGLGLTLSATATTATPSVTDADGTAGPAPSGGSVAGQLISKDLIITESDGAPGVYTATLAIPAGATIFGIALHTEQAWATAAGVDEPQLDVFDSGAAFWGGSADTGPVFWAQAMTVTALDQVQMFTDFSGTGAGRGPMTSIDDYPRYPSGTTLTARVTTTVTEASPSGVTRVKVTYFTAADESASTFVATP